MAEESDKRQEVQPMEELQAHLTKQKQSSKLAGLKMSSGQAEKLMGDLEATASKAQLVRKSISAMHKEDEILANQSRTQVLHEGAQGEIETSSQMMLCHKDVVEGLSKQAEKANTDPDPRTASDDNHCRDERIRRMEGPADNAWQLAEKLTYFTYYEILYLDDDATTEEIHQAYVKRTTDIRSRFRSGIEEWRLSEFIRALHEAHSVLTNEKLRREYDERLAAGDWFGGFRDLVERVPDYRVGTRGSGREYELVSLKDLLLCGGFVTQAELDQYEENQEDTPDTVPDGPELAQIIADAGLITFEELASLFLGKALIDRKQITIEQFKLAVGDMREHSHKLVDVLISQGWLTASEKNLIDID